MFQYIYTLPIGATVAALCFAFVAWYDLIKTLSKRNDLRFWRWFRFGCAFVLLAWAVCVVYATVLARTEPEISVNLTPFSHITTAFSGGERELVRTDWMNLLLFVPLGMLLPFLFPQKTALAKKVVATAVLGLVFSLSVEFLQYARSVGSFETDDIIFNTLGALVGTIPFIIYYKKTKQ